MATIARMRLQKFLAESGVASRRGGEELIRQGRVSLNGDVVTRLGTTVDPEHDRIAVDGSLLRRKKKLYVALHKPRGYICSRSDPQRRKTLGDLLPKEWSDLYPVGRLDYASEGLIFLTNDGEFCLKLSHPRYEVRKRYHVWIKGRMEGPQLEILTRGVKDSGELLRADKVVVLEKSSAHSMLEIELTEGKNREIRRLLGFLGAEVERLLRVQIGSIKLGELPAGKWRTLTGAEIKSLLTTI